MLLCSSDRPAAEALPQAEPERTLISGGGAPAYYANYCQHRNYRGVEAYCAVEVK